MRLLKRWSYQFQHIFPPFISHVILETLAKALEIFLHFLELPKLLLWAWTQMMATRYTKLLTDTIAGVVQIMNQPSSNAFVSDITSSRWRQVYKIFLLIRKCVEFFFFFYKYANYLQTDTLYIFHYFIYYM